MSNVTDLDDWRGPSILVNAADLPEGGVFVLSLEAVEAWTRGEKVPAPPDAALRAMVRDRLKDMKEGR